MSERLRVLIADDEPLALRRLTIALASMPDVEVVGAASDGRAASEAIRRLDPDVALLDVRMPGLDGFAVVEALAVDAAPAVIFISAFESYAVRAFSSNAVDYLLKPVEFPRLADALSRARARRQSLSAERRAAELSEIVRALREEARGRDGQRYESEFWVRDRGRFVRARVDEIERITAERDYVRLHWKGRSLLVRETMADLEHRLDPAVMIRIHRSSFVNIAFVQAVRRGVGGRLIVELASGLEAPVGRTYAQSLTDMVHARR
jgi:DNA-binding LytR/AlgR family response regulator